MRTTQRGWAAEVDQFPNRDRPRASPFASLQQPMDHVFYGVKSTKQFTAAPFSATVLPTVSTATGRRLAHARFLRCRVPSAPARVPCAGNGFLPVQPRPRPSWHRVEPKPPPALPRLPSHASIAALTAPSPAPMPAGYRPPTIPKQDHCLLLELVRVLPSRPLRRRHQHLRSLMSLVEVSSVTRDGHHAGGRNGS